MKTLFQQWKREISVAFTHLLLLLVLAVVRPSFFDPANLGDLILHNVPVLVAAVGMTLVILAGQIDISIGSQFAIVGVVAALAAKTGLPMPLVAVVAMVVGGTLGLMNGALIGGLGLPSIVVTLATMVIFQQGLRWITEGTWIQDLPQGFQWLGLGQATGQVVIVLTSLAIFAIFAWAMTALSAGRKVYAVGSNEEAARLAGIRPRRVVLTTYILLGALVGVGALLNAIRFPQVPSNAGEGLELKVIAAVVLGGTSIKGGRGTLMGTLIGVALLGTIGPALTFLEINAFWEKAIQGGIILAAVASDGLFNRTTRDVRTNLAAH